jgi:hypothetical protein
MGIANVTWYILILWSVYGCVQKIGAYEFKIINEVQNFQNLDFGYVELCYGCNNLWTMYTFTLLK